MAGNAAPVASLSDLFADLRRIRERFGEACRAEVPGMPGAHSYAEALLREMSGRLAQEAPSRKDWALVASGGFGRGELSFLSDLDLLFLYKRRLPEELKGFIQSFIAGLWDSGFEVGHVVSSQSGLKELMAEDFSVATTYLETAFLSGDRSFYEQWRRNLIGAPHGPRQKRRFLDKLCSSRQSRFAQYGESIYLLEPHIKEGVGGLRDIHILRWIGMYFLSDPEPGGMERSGWITAQERAWLEQAQDFLWRVRLQLHAQSGRRRDQLLLADQEGIARALGFVDDAATISAVEAFMRQYYRVTARTRRVATFVLEKLDQELRSSRVRSRKRKVLPGPFLLEGELLRFYDPDLIRTTPELLMEFFWQAAQSRAHFHHDTGHIIREHLDAFAARARETDAVIEQFFDILLDPDMAFAVLKVMLETGFLEAFIPEFTPIRYRVQFDVYHVYTVDEHLLRTVRELHRLERSEGEAFPNRGYGMDRLFAEIGSKRVLFLAALVHDIGKGAGSGHAARGADMVAAIGRRLKLDEGQQELLRFLVRHHLLLADTALKRDLTEERPIEHCALAVKDKARLNMLYLLTVADSKATGPQVWTSWRKSLFRELFVKVSHYLEQESWDGQDLSGRLSRITSAVQRMNPERRSSEALAAWLEKLSMRYLLAQPPESIVEHFQMEQNLEAAPLAFRVRPLEGSMWEVTLACQDRPGLFEQVTGVLWANGLNILSADLYTRSYGVALDVLILDGVPDPLNPDRIWERVESDLRAVILEAKPLEELVARRGQGSWKRHGPRVKMEDKVVITEDASDFYTVLEVYTWERPGVLHAISTVLHDFGLSIKTAKITTPGAQVVDVFYVQDEAGNKIQDPSVHGALEARLLETLQRQ